MRLSRGEVDTKIKGRERVSSCDGMALLDKHKVKRQRLDRICEGETESLTPLSFLSALDLRCWLKMCEPLEIDHLGCRMFLSLHI